MSEIKPPLGLEPRDIVEHGFNVYRMGEIMGAIKRYSEAQKPIPVEWVTELIERMQSYMNEVDNE